MKEPRGVRSDWLAELAPWLVIAALGDWLLLRTVSRTAIFMPKTPLLAEVFLWLGQAGQFAANTTTLLAFLCLGWMIWRESQHREGWPLAAALTGLLIASILFVFVPPGGWLAATHWLLVAVVGFLILRMQRRGWRSLAILPAGLALLLAVLHLALPGQTLGLFWAGEVFAVTAPVALWWRCGRGASRTIQIGALLPALTFALVYLGSPSMTGTIVVWSTGLTLFLPWWMYGLGLWAAGVVVGQSLLTGSGKEQRMMGYGLLLLAAGGYGPQLSVHQFLGLIGLYLLLAGELRDRSPLTDPRAISATFPLSPSRVSPPA